MAENDPSEIDPFFPIQKPKHDDNGKIMLIAVISLSIVILLVFILHLYSRFLIRNRDRQRAALVRYLSPIRRTQIEQPGTGLDQSVIGSLPVFVFRHTDHNQTESNIECSVCLSMFEDGDMVRTLPNCKHNFHAKCIDQWLENQTTCPVCRTEAKPIRLLPMPREGVVGPVVTGVELRTSGLLTSGEGTSNEGSVKLNVSSLSSSSRLSSFRRILSRDQRSSGRIHDEQEDHIGEDVERQ